MDEQISLLKLGKKIPAWDLQHRLPLHMPVGPICKDTATIFRINSIFMDVTDQQYMNYQMAAGGVLAACLSVSLIFRLTIKILQKLPDEFTMSLFFLFLVIFINISIFSFIAFKFGKHQFFSITRRPIRFNRKEKTIYAIHGRRFFPALREEMQSWKSHGMTLSFFVSTRALAETGNTTIFATMKLTQTTM
jgi:hypothetical protein